MAQGRKADPVRLTYRRLLMLGALLLVLFAASGAWNAWHKERESAELRVESQTALATMQTQYTQLSAQVASLESKRGKEAAIREEYKVGKPGEGLIIVVDPSTKTPAQATTTIMQKIERFFWWW